MSNRAVEVISVVVENNPATFQSPLKLHIQGLCRSPLAEALEWKVVYVGSAQTEKNDQELDCVEVGPMPVGKFAFLLECDAPNVKLIPNQDVLGMTALLLIGLYKNKEFIRVGFFVNNYYEEGSELAMLYKKSTESDGGGDEASDEGEESEMEAAKKLTKQDSAEPQKDQGVSGKSEKTEEVAKPSSTKKKISVPIVVEKIIRNIDFAHPRVTRYDNPWDDASHSSAQLKFTKVQYKPVQHTEGVDSKTEAIGDDEELEEEEDKIESEGDDLLTSMVDGFIVEEEEQDPALTVEPSKEQSGKEQLGDALPASSGKEPSLKRQKIGL